MKQVIIILMITIMVSLPVCVQAQYPSIDRQPFSELSYSVSLPQGNKFVNGNNSFSDAIFSRAGGPGDGLPGGNEGGGGWVGMPVKDTYWFLLVIAIGYGIIRRKKCA